MSAKLRAEGDRIPIIALRALEMLFVEKLGQPPNQPPNLPSSNKQGALLSSPD